VVLRVYLDQDKWIELSRARWDRPGGKPPEGVWELVVAAVELGRASFPLSGGHYIETHRRQDWASRVRLVHTMIELSRLHTIVPPNCRPPAGWDHLEVSFASGMGPPVRPSWDRLSGWLLGVGAAAGVSRPVTGGWANSTAAPPPAQRKRRGDWVSPRSAATGLARGTT